MWVPNTIWYSFHMYTVTAYFSNGLPSTCLKTLKKIFMKYVDFQNLESEIEPKNASSSLTLFSSLSLQQFILSTLLFQEHFIFHSCVPVAYCNSCFLQHYVQLHLTGFFVLALLKSILWIFRHFLLRSFVPQVVFFFESAGTILFCHLSIFSSDLFPAEISVNIYFCYPKG